MTYQPKRGADSSIQGQGVIERWLHLVISEILFIATGWIRGKCCVGSAADRHAAVGVVPEIVDLRPAVSWCVRHQAPSSYDVFATLWVSLRRTGPTAMRS